MGPQGHWAQLLCRSWVLISYAFSSQVQGALMPVRAEFRQDPGGILSSICLPYAAL